MRGYCKALKKILSFEQRF